MNKVPTRTELGRSGDMLFIALVAVSFLLTFATPRESLTPLRAVLLIVDGVGYTLVGLVGSRHIERRATPGVLALYFSLQLLQGAVFVYLSEAGGILILLPVAAESIELLPRPWAIVVCALTVLAVIGPMALIVGLAALPDGTHPYPWFSSQFFAALTPLSLQFGMAFVFVVLYSIAGARERAAHAETERLAAELRQANAQLREYAAQAEELATVPARNRLAREIHDGLGHYLTGINMQIQAGRAVLDLDRDAALDALDQAQALAQEGLSEVRRSVAALRASPLDNQSLPQAIEGLVNECRAAGIATAYQVLGEQRDLSPQVSMVLYRVAQEGMTNMRKYAQASSAEVTLDYQDGNQIRLTVCDSGVGTDDPSGGYGLIGVRERVQLLGGQVQIETAPGEGLCLRVLVPAEIDHRPNNHT